MQQLEQQYGEGNSKDGPDVNKQPDKIDVLFDALNDIDYLLSTIGGPTFFLSVYIFCLFISLIDFGVFLGPYGAFHCAHVYIRILERTKSRAKTAQFLTDLIRVSALCQEVR
jgi:hypothetical protein